MRDFYPEDMELRNRIFDAWTQTATTFGFLPYDACTVETLDLLKRKSGEEIVDQIYCFHDKSGRDLALRPEMTPTLARMVAARQGSLAFPLKWHTIAQCFRYERMTRGRKREHYQWNLDIIGEESPSAEAEVVSAAVHALMRMGLRQQDVRVHYNSRALLGELLEKLGIEPHHHPATFLALDKRGKRDDAEIATLLKEDGLDSDVISQVFEVLEVKTLNDALGHLPADSAARANLETFSGFIDAYGLSDVVEFDLSVVRGLTYYTGIVFEAFDRNQEFRAIFGGGRYDDLLADVGGKPATGVGLGFGDVVVAELLADRGIDTTPTGTGLILGFMDSAQQHTALALAAGFRAMGTAVSLGLHAEKAKSFFSRAAKGGYRHAIYLGPDDVEKGTLRIKDLETREETETPIEQILQKT